MPAEIWTGSLRQKVEEGQEPSISIKDRDISLEIRNSGNLPESLDKIIIRPDCTEVSIILEKLDNLMGETYLLKSPPSELDTEYLITTRLDPEKGLMQTVLLQDPGASITLNGKVEEEERRMFTKIVHNPLRARIEKTKNNENN